MSSVRLGLFSGFRGTIVAPDPADAAAPVNKEEAHLAPANFTAYRRKVKTVRRVIDLYTFSPYFKTRAQFGMVRLVLALYTFATL